MIRCLREASFKGFVASILHAYSNTAMAMRPLVAVGRTSRMSTTLSFAALEKVLSKVETADMTRNTILQQSAVSILSQANMQPQLALSLL